MNMGTIREIMDILQESYGMASASPIDRVVATNILQFLYGKGWMDSSEIAILVKAAGGEIRVPENMLTGDTPFLYKQQDPMTGEIIFRSREKGEATSNAKVNPDAEVRTVDSGPINLSAVNTEKRNASSDHYS